MELKCNACDCIHNKQESCNAHVIQVNESGSRRKGKDVFCNTYAQNENGSGLLTNQPINFVASKYGALSEEYATDFNGESPQVACKALKCVHNKNLECKAHDINILAPHNNDLKCECETFCLK